MNMDDMEPFVVVNVRHVLGVTQQRFAELMGVSIRAVQQWEAKSGGSQHRHPTQTAVHLMRALLDGWRPKGI